ncbi:hypothetical protein [Frankia sp. AgB32]|uniref:hypothetical protein n=1 Tax=Frankia sp. AgB32 TaxID=631119 RepID=UPI002010404D|nr:hypothetical protein [Frankia sp. AgB32]MCK9897691.1 hypothetical protein [Frankia sp. AgB32]
MAVPTPDDAAAALAEAGASRAQLAGGLGLPSCFHSSIGVTVALQIAAAAVEVAFDTGWTRLLAVAAAALFALTAGVQLSRFRRLNGVRIGGLTSRVVLGTGWAAASSYAVALGGAFWAALTGRWWLVALCACAGGLAYAGSGRRWLRLYRRDPAAHARGEPAGWLVVLSALALAVLALLVLVGR